MIHRLVRLWDKMRASLWFVPTWMSVAAAGLALASRELEPVLAGSILEPFLYPGDREGAMTLLSTVAGSMITVAGVTFSVTVVALSLASSQFGPRLLVNFMRDRGNQLVLGTFIATFLFCLLALGQGGDDPEAVPTVSATLGLALALASVAVLIYFIHHVSSSIRAEQVIDGVARDLEGAVERLFPRTLAESGDDVEATHAETDFRDGPATTASRDGYVQWVDEERLLAIATGEGLVLRALRRPGHFVVEGEALVVAQRSGGAAGDDGEDALAPEVAEHLRACFLLGRQRTPGQDPEYGVHQLVEVAVRALSPGVNDPYTALSCVDWLGAVLCKVGSRPLRSPRRRDADGTLRLVVDPITFGGMLAAAFNQIRQCAQTTPAVSIRMLETLERVGRSVSADERRTAVRVQADMVFHGGLFEGMQECDRRDMEERHRAVMEVLGEAART